MTPKSEASRLRELAGLIADSQNVMPDKKEWKLWIENAVFAIDKEAYQRGREDERKEIKEKT